MEDSPASNSDAFSPPSAAALRELEARARTALSAQRVEVTQLEAEITKQLDAISAAISEHRAGESADGKQAADARAEAERLRAETDAAHAAWESERSEQEAELDRLRLELQQTSTEQDLQSTQLAELCAKLDSREADLEKQSAALREREAAFATRLEEFEAKCRDQETAHESREAEEVAWKAERAALEAKRDELLEKIASLEADHEATHKESANELANFEQKLQEQQASWAAQRDEWKEARADLEHERDELKQKFELALQDVQRFRGRAADLEQELARRPEANEADSAELVALRAERDALAERIEQLEQQPVASVDADAEQQMADLQRRFELAVEDVRELKTKNADLESKLAAAGQTRPTASSESSGMDWESQKRRMLASLADEPEDEDEEREKERATIENTIEMTDAVVAEKDREIEALKAQVATASSAAAKTDKDERDEKMNEILDADEVIAEHRKRIATIEREMEDKLRAAELELSVERAKLARQKVELEELRSDLDSQRQSYEASGGAATAGAPRRRWLSKLGLSGDEQR